MRRSVRAATTITADDLLDATCQPEQGEIYKIAHFTPFEIPAPQWRHHHGTVLELMSGAFHGAMLGPAISTSYRPSHGHAGAKPRVPGRVCTRPGTLAHY